MPNSWTEPRTAPPTLLPAIAGAIVILVALPLFLLAGWRVVGLGDRCGALVRQRGVRSGPHAASNPNG